MTARPRHRPPCYRLRPSRAANVRQREEGLGSSGGARRALRCSPVPALTPGRARRPRPQDSCAPTNLLYACRVRGLTLALLDGCAPASFRSSCPPLQMQWTRGWPRQSVPGRPCGAATVGRSAPGRRQCCRLRRGSGRAPGSWQPSPLRTRSAHCRWQTEGLGYPQTDSSQPLPLRTRRGPVVRATRRARAPRHPPGYHQGARPDTRPRPSRPLGD